jgi:structural maintenance of chromosomes protein 5
VKKIKEIQGHNAKWQKELDNPPKLEDLEGINAEMVREPTTTT